MVGHDTTRIKDFVIFVIEKEPKGKSCACYARNMVCQDGVEIKFSPILTF